MSPGGRNDIVERLKHLCETLERGSVVASTQSDCAHATDQSSCRTAPAHYTALVRFAGQVSLHRHACMAGGTRSSSRAVYIDRCSIAWIYDHDSSAYGWRGAGAPPDADHVQARRASSAEPGLDKVRLTSEEMVIRIVKQSRVAVPACASAGNVHIERHA